MKSHLALSLTALLSLTTGAAFAQSMPPMMPPAPPCPVGTLIDTPTKKVKTGNYMGYFAKAEFTAITGPGGTETKTIDICLNSGGGNHWARAYEVKSKTTIENIPRSPTLSEQVISTTTTQKMYALSLQNPGQIDPTPVSDDTYTDESRIITRMVPDLNGQLVATHENVTSCSHYMTSVQRFLNQPSITTTHDASAEAHDFKDPNNVSYQKKAKVSTIVKQNGVDILEVALNGESPLTTSGVRVQGSGYRGVNDNDKGHIDIRIAAPNDGGDFPNRFEAQWSMWINGVEQSTKYPPAVLQQHLLTAGMVYMTSIDSTNLFMADMIGPHTCGSAEVFAEIGRRIIPPPMPPLV